MAVVYNHVSVKLSLLLGIMERHARGICFNNNNAIHHVAQLIVFGIGLSGIVLPMHLKIVTYVVVVELKSVQSSQFVFHLVVGKLVVPAKIVI